MMAASTGLSAQVVEYEREHPFWPAARYALRLVAGYALLYTMLFMPVLRAEKLLAPGDACTVYLSAFRADRSAWDPTLLSGFPAQGDPRRLAWYLPAIFASYCPGDFNVLVVSAYVLASAFIHDYVKLLTRSSAAATLSGLVYGMSGFMIAHLGHTSLIHAWAWIPAVLLSLEKLRQRLAAVWIAALAVSIANLLLIGQAHIVFGVTWTVLYAVFAGTGARDGRWRYYRAAVIGFALGAALAAVLLLPWHQLAKGAPAVILDYGHYTSFHFPLKQMPQLIFPRAFGGTGGLAYFGQGNIAETTCYLGLGPLALAALGAALHPDRRVARYWIAAAAGALLFALGPDAGASRLLFHLPVLNRLPYPARHLGEMALAVSVLSGLGMAWLASASPRNRCLACALTTVLLVGVATAAWLAWAYCGLPASATPHGRLPWNVPAIRPSLIFLAAAVAALWVYAAAPHWITAGILATAVALDLGACARSADWSSNAVDESVLQCPPILTKYRQELLLSGQRLTGLASPPVTPLDAPLANLATLWQLPSTGGEHPLASQRAVQLGLPSHDCTSHGLLRDENCVLDLMAASYILVPKKLLDPATAEHRIELARSLETPRFARIDELDGCFAFKNMRARPRAWLVTELRQHSEGEILRALQKSQLSDSSQFDPARTALVERPCSFSHAANDSGAAAVVGEIAPGFARIETESSAASFCVLSDMYYPGWRATIDGNPAEIYRTDFVLMGVVVPSGKHTLIFRYVPTRFYLGAAVSFGALVIVLALLVHAAVRSA